MSAEVGCVLNVATISDVSAAQVVWDSESHSQSREDRVRILTVVRLVTDPGLIVIEDAEALTAAVAAVAVAGASVGVRLMLRDEIKLGEAEVAQTALRCFVTRVHAVLALPARAVAKCHCAGRQQARHASDADVTATTMLAIDTGRKELHWCRRWRWCRHWRWCRRRRRSRVRITTSARAVVVPTRPPVVIMIGRPTTVATAVATAWRGGSGSK